ncbi:hypothetical protein D3C76_1841100 [compost metagenome]
MRQETDIGPVNLKHSANSHRYNGNKEAHIIHDVPNAKRFSFMHIKHFTKNKGDDKEKEPQH